MGNQPPKPNQTRKCELNHPVLRTGLLIKDKQQLQIELTMPMPDKKLVTQWEARVSQYRVTEFQAELLFLPKWIEFEQEAFCGSTGFAKVRYSAPPLLLSEELENRIKIMQSFTEEEIWYLLYVLTYAAEKIHARSLIIGDIRPNNIFLFADGNVSVGCLASFPDQIPNYLKTLQYKQRTFLSPEQQFDLKQQKPDSQNQFISENFSIGVTIMGLMLLHDEQVLYWQDDLYFEEVLRKQVINLANCSFYSEMLRKIVIGLLLEDVEERFTSAEVAAILKPYEESIMNLDSFKFNSAHVKQLLKVNNVRLLDYRRSKLPACQLPLQFYSFGQPNQNVGVSRVIEQRFSTFAEGEAKSGSNSIQVPQSSKETKAPDNQIKNHMNQLENNGPRSINIPKQQKTETKSDNGAEFQYDSKSDVGIYNNEEFESAKLKKNNGYTYVSPIQYKSKYLELPTQNQTLAGNMVTGFTLDNMGRQAKSIKNTSQKKDRSGNKSQYENVLKHIDEQLQRSRKLFPNGS